MNALPLAFMQTVGWPEVLIVLAVVLFFARRMVLRGLGRLFGRTAAEFERGRTEEGHAGRMGAKTMSNPMGQREGVFLSWAILATVLCLVFAFLWVRTPGERTAAGKTPSQAIQGAWYLPYDVDAKEWWETADGTLWIDAAEWDHLVPRGVQRQMRWKVVWEDPKRKAMRVKVAEHERTLFFSPDGDSFYSIVHSNLPEADGKKHFWRRKEGTAAVTAGE